MPEINKNKGEMIMFFTGVFKFENGIITTCQRSHDKEEYDD